MLIYTGSDEVTIEYTVNETAYDDVYTGRSLDNFTIWYTKDGNKNKGMIASNELIDGVGKIVFKINTSEVGSYTYRIELATGARESANVKSKRLAVGAVIRVSADGVIEVYDIKGDGGSSIPQDDDVIAFKLLSCDSAGVILTGTPPTMTVDMKVVSTDIDTEFNGSLVPDIEITTTKAVVPENCIWTYYIVKAVSAAYNTVLDVQPTGTILVKYTKATATISTTRNVNEVFTLQDKVDGGWGVSKVTNFVDSAFSGSGEYTTVIYYNNSYDKVITPIKYI